MCSGHLQGRILKMLTSMIAPKRVLELGTFSPYYSTLCIAEGLQPGATLDTVEIDDEMDDELRERFADYPSITLHIGDAAEVVGRMPGEWDMVFVDADKRRYPEYLAMLKPRMAPRRIYPRRQHSLVGTGGGRRCRPRSAVARHSGIQPPCGRRSGTGVGDIPLRDGLSLIKRL